MIQTNYVTHKLRHSSKTGVLISRVLSVEELHAVQFTTEISPNNLSATNDLYAVRNDIPSCSAGSCQWTSRLRGTVRKRGETSLTALFRAYHFLTIIQHFLVHDQHYLQVELPPPHYCFTSPSVICADRRQVSRHEV
jgi:hypothetical protein